MKYFRTLIPLLAPFFLVVGCTYDKGITFYSQVCKTSFTGFPDIPGWNFEYISEEGAIEYGQQIYFFDEKKGILIDDEAIYLTENEGADWTKVFSSSYLVVFDISFSDARTGFLSGLSENKSCILKTIDGGHTWSILFQLTSDIIRVFSFANAQHGIAIIHSADSLPPVGHYFIAKSNNGGSNWIKIAGLSVSSPANATIKMHQNGFGYILGTHGDIHFTNDFGDSWTTLNTGANIDHIQFLDQKTGFLSDFSHMFRTIDGGTTWWRISEHWSPWFHFFSSTEGISLQTIAIDVIPDKFEEIYACNAFFTIFDGKTTWEEGPPSLSFYIDDVNFVNDHLGYGKTYQDGIRIVKLYR